MIYAQKPQATACAGYAFWKERMHRYVKQGSKGIAIFDEKENSAKLRDVFDITDTEGSPKTLPYFWRIQSQQEERVVFYKTMLKERKEL